MNSKKKNQKKSFIGNYIKEKRILLGLSQKDLGLALNGSVTTQFISNIERGITPLPARHLETIAKALKAPPEELLLLLEKDYAQKVVFKTSLDTFAKQNREEETSKKFFFAEGTEGNFLLKIQETFKKLDPKEKVHLIDSIEGLLKEKKKS